MKILYMPNQFELKKRFYQLSEKKTMYFNYLPNWLSAYRHNGIIWHLLFTDFPYMRSWSLAASFPVLRT